MMTTARRDDSPDLPLLAPQASFLTTIQVLAKEHAAQRAAIAAKDAAIAELRAELARRDAEAAKADAWKVPKAAASLSDTPKSTIYRWVKDECVKCRINASGKVEIYMESVFDCIRQLGRR